MRVKPLSQELLVRFLCITYHFDQNDCIIRSVQLVYITLNQQKVPNGPSKNRFSF